MDGDQVKRMGDVSLADRRRSLQERNRQLEQDLGRVSAPWR